MSEITWEAETQINFNEEGDTASIYTASKRVAELMQRRGMKTVRVDKQDGQESGWWFEVPRSAVLIKPGKNMIRIGGARRINSTVSSAALGATSSKVS